MKNKRKYLLPLAKRINILSLIKKSGVAGFFPAYHIVSPDPEPHIHHLYGVKTPSEFEKDLEEMMKIFKPVSATDLRNKPAFPHFHLSVDDGFSQVYDHIAPILYKKGIPATFFVNPAFVNNQELMFRNKISLLLHHFHNASGKVKKQFLIHFQGKETNFRERDFLSMGFDEGEKMDEMSEYLDFSFHEFLDRKKPYMSMEQLKDLSNRGFLIGAHSWDHPEFYRIDEEEQFRQVDKSMNYISKNFNPALKAFSFPFHDGGVSKGFFDKMRSSGIDISFGSAGVKLDSPPFHYQRTFIDEGFAMDKARVEYLYFILRKAIGKHKIHRY